MALGDLVTDGENAVTIDCASVESGSGTFDVDVSLRTRTFTFDARATIPQGGRGTGTVEIGAAEIGFLQSVDTMPCNFWVDQGNLSVGPGVVWAAFNCPQVREQPSSMCSIPQGVMAFELCDE
jgi:hypothetical protein